MSYCRKHLTDNCIECAIERQTELIIRHFSQCQHLKKPVYRLCINQFSKRSNPKNWFKLKLCCPECGVINEELDK